jgi:hypothetical protein
MSGSFFLASRINAPVLTLVKARTERFVSQFVVACRSSTASGILFQHSSEISTLYA